MRTFTTVTYNVLAQSFVHDDRYPYCSAEALDPTPRHNLLLDRIEQFGADLLCLQELEPAIYDAVCARLEATHYAAYAPRSRRPDGLAEPSDHLPLQVDFTTNPVIDQPRAGTLPPAGDGNRLAIHYPVSLPATEHEKPSERKR